MSRVVVFAFVCWSVFLLTAQGDGKPGVDDWKYDVIHRKQGVSLKGLIVEQGSNSVRIRCISRKPGSPTVVFTELIPKREIARLVQLSNDDRAILQKRLDALKREREVLANKLLGPRGKSPERSADALDLKESTWPHDKKVKALSYHSSHFTLVASSRAELVKLVAIQLEQVYAAYARSLPPRTTKNTPTTILLTGSLDEYHKLAKAHNLKLMNPAFYDPNRNEIVCGSDLERLCDEREKVRKHHDALRQSMKERKLELGKIYRNKIPAELLTPMLDAEKRIVVVEKRNDDAFTKVQQRLFRRLYHEAFHAYLNTFVYPAKEGSLALWLNEGLAQIFETAIIEVGELRVGHADPERLKAIRTALAQDKLLSLTELLKSGPRNFQVAHVSDQHASDRYYLASWGLAFYLTFELRLLGTKALDEHVKALKRGTDPLLAFRDLVGKPLPQFEKEYLQYLKKLREDGTVGK